MTLTLLKAQLRVRRHGVLSIAAAVAFVAALLLYGLAWRALDHLIDEAKQEQRTLIAARSAPPPVEDRDELLAQRHEAFMAILRQRDQVPSLLRDVFSEAKHSGVMLNQAEYRMIDQRRGGFSTYQVVLPVKGNYTAIRGFAQAALAALPAAALEEISFKRDGIGNESLEARMKFSVLLRAAEDR